MKYGFKDDLQCFTVVYQLTKNCITVVIVINCYITAIGCCM